MLVMVAVFLEDRVMSKFVEWSNQLSMGIEEIDAQH
ncbi:hypothetical protein BN873_610119 [Candidatus Competibacter denitrificans Run_A_D11]|uniref:Uncharacterized protein n=1 Tax=Candidatus Competibacter denitrificans Run_A_D11 TaxID=1400863 RepID=W6M7W0_9GAMM|nr:hypothetical protein BN873_610119 [Candidatus Competibacter denitrificans Run_A_D11]